jgi:hypothetical protein
VNDGSSSPRSSKFLSKVLQVPHQGPPSSSLRSSKFLYKVFSKFLFKVFSKFLFKVLFKVLSGPPSSSSRSLFHFEVEL